MAKSSVRAPSVRRIVSMFTYQIAEGPITLAYGRSLRAPSVAHDLACSVLKDCPTEEFWAIHLDGKHRVVGMAQVSVGTLTTSLVHPREVFGSAVRLAAAALVVVHNHPSGDPEPSMEDLEVTQRLVEAGKILGIPLLDHIVSGETSFVSLRSRGIIA
jgi:DNA repair protein RadC